jgi:cell wall assembly regulator SMI1
MIVITEQGPPVKEVEIVAFEQELGARLPSDYRKFLLEHNGGRPKPDTIDIDRLPGSPTGVSTFFGFDQEFEADDLRWNREILSDDLGDPSLLPIASDPFGNIFCMVAYGPDVGTILFIDFVESVPYEYFVASSFLDFLSQLREWDSTD